MKLLKHICVFLKDLDKKICEKSGQPCTGKCHIEDTAQPKTPQPPPTESCQSSQGCGGGSSVPLHIVTARAQWFKPTSTSELYDLLDKYCDANYRLVFGNTGFGKN